MTCRLYAVKHVKSVFLPVQARGAARLFAATGVHLPTYQASVTIVIIISILDI